MFRMTQLLMGIVLLAFLLLLVECANLYLLYRLALLLYGRGRATTIAWIYTALFVPIFFWLGNFDALTTFFILLGLYSLIKNKNKMLALALGLGAMVKFLPILLIAPIWRARGFKSALIYGGTTLLISLAMFGPFALANPTMTVASLQAQAGKSSYQTVWAMIDNNDTTGSFGPLIDHFEAAKATQPIGNPARIPTWLSLIPFALLGLFIFTRPQIPGHPNLDIVVFTTLTFVIFFLWSQGWSPQWQVMLIPFILLVFPNGHGVLYCLVLGFVNFLEWPVILSRGFNRLLMVTVPLRTLLVLLLLLEFYRQSRASSSQPSRRLQAGE